MAITDEVVGAPDIDETRTVAMGGSFGGYMANWVAGHTDRFRAIVTHASLWNLETFGPTTDAAWYWGREMSPEMMRAELTAPATPTGSGPRCWSSTATRTTGCRSRRVWPSGGRWSRTHDGPAGGRSLHKFLYFPDENHWVLTPQHARLWYETVFAFLDTNLNGVPFRRPDGV